LFNNIQVAKIQNEKIPNQVFTRKWKLLFITFISLRPLRDNFVFPLRLPAGRQGLMYLAINYFD
jgi:hypothetical protein